MSKPDSTLTGDANLELPEFNAPPADPIALLGEWVRSAADAGVREPWAATLATADTAGRPSSRTVMIKHLDDQGLVFNSVTGSRKGQELQANPWASVTFYWRERLQQLTVAGKVHILTDQESDADFTPRPRAAQASAAASQQSRPLENEAALRQRAADLRDSDGPIERPAEWVAYRLIPERIEFWYGSADRMHRRLQYQRSSASAWESQRLQP